MEITKIEDRWAIVSDYIRGRTLDRLMKENPDKADEYLNLFVDLQLEMHSKKVPLLNSLREKMNRKISQADLDATTRYDLHTRLEAMPKHDKLCHGDFNPSNIIISDDGTRIYSTGRMRHAATHLRTLHAPICSFGLQAISPRPTSISNSSAPRAIRRNSTFRNGCR